MKALCVLALLALPGFTLSSEAQERRPLPPDSFQYDGLPRLNLRSFQAPTPVTVENPQELSRRPLPPGSFQDDRLPLRSLGSPPPAPKPAEKPKRAIG